MSEPKGLSGGITADQLKELLATVIAEARKPVVTEAQIKELEAQQAMRKDIAADVKQQAINKKRFQDNCSHMRRDGSTRAVFVKQNPPDEDFMICQLCQDVTYASKEPQEFNRLFQLAGAADMFA